MKKKRNTENKRQMGNVQRILNKLSIYLLRKRINHWRVKNRLVLIQFLPSALGLLQNIK